MEKLTHAKFLWVTSKDYGSHHPTIQTMSNITPFIEQIFTMWAIPNKDIAKKFTCTILRYSTEGVHSFSQELDEYKKRAIQGEHPKILINEFIEIINQ